MFARGAIPPSSKSLYYLWEGATTTEALGLSDPDMLKKKLRKGDLQGDESQPELSLWAQIRDLEEPDTMRDRSDLETLDSLWYLLKTYKTS